jgi:hypothetical protein
MRNKAVVSATVGIAFLLHHVLQWFSWAMADSIGHRHPFPFRLLSFPVIWLLPASGVSSESPELWLALNSAVWAGIIGLLVAFFLRRVSNGAK